MADYPEVRTSFHYCDTIWGWDKDGGSISISESWKRCKGADYKKRQKDKMIIVPRSKSKSFLGDSEKMKELIHKSGIN